MSAQIIYVVTVAGKPVYSNTSQAAADYEADQVGGIVTSVYLFSGGRS